MNRTMKTTAVNLTDDMSHITIYFDKSLDQFNINM